MLKGKEIILGVTSGIAAYKAAELVRLMVKKEANVHVVMTQNAQKFITPHTFQTLSGNPVVTDPFALLEDAQIGHIALADLAELVVILPATANIIGKIANGIADDFLSTMVMATKAPVLFVPSMNVNMWKNKALQKNIQTLLETGYHLLEPGEGELACHWYGKGRLPELNEVVEKIEDMLSPKDLKGEQILITGGPTQEPIDPKIPGVEKDHVALAKDVLLGKVDTGDSVVIIGGGQVGAETAEFLAEKGKRVAIIEILDEIAQGMPGIARVPLLCRLEELGVKILTKADAKEIRRKEVIVQHKRSLRTVVADTVVIATGSEPNMGSFEKLRDAVPESYVIGDAVSSRSFLETIAEGFDVGLRL